MHQKYMAFQIKGYIVTEHRHVTEHHQNNKHSLETSYYYYNYYYYLCRIV
jgi:hypothetical protein